MEKRQWSEIGKDTQLDPQLFVTKLVHTPLHLFDLHLHAPPPPPATHTDWQAVGPPHKQRYMQFSGQPAAAAAAATTAAADGPAAAAAADGQAAPSPSAGALLASVKQQLFESAAFARLLRAMLGVDILKHAGAVRRFRAGGCVCECVVVAWCLDFVFTCIFCAEWISKTTKTISRY